MSQSRAIVFVILFGVVGLATACSGAVSATTSQGSPLNASYPNALNNRTLLLLGTIRLEEGNRPALTKEQAVKLLPLWQTSKSLMASGTASNAEMDAVTNQILAAMTAEQVQAINAMHLVQADMLAFNQTLGVTAPSNLASGGLPGQGPMPGGVPGQGQSQSPSERATRQAEFGGAGGGTAGVSYLLDILQRTAGR